MYFLVPKLCVTKNGGKKGNIKQDVRDLIEKHGDVEIVSDLSKSRVFDVSSEIFPLFTENFDFHNLQDLIIGLQLFNAYGYKIDALLSDNIQTKSIFETKKKINISTISVNNVLFTAQVISQGSETDLGYIKYTGSETSKNIITSDIAYGKSINTLQDYFEINTDFRTRRFSPFSFENYIDYKEKQYKCMDGNYIKEYVKIDCYMDKSILGKSEINANTIIKSSNVCNGCVVKTDIQYCIIWDDVNVSKNLNGCLVISNDENGIICLNRIEETDQSEDEVEEECEDTCFTDIGNYLLDIYKK